MSFTRRARLPPGGHALRVSAAQCGRLIWEQQQHGSMRERTASAFDVESWRAFISEKIVPMRDEAAALLNFWAFLKSLEGRYLSEVLREHPKLEPLFLGGTKPPGEYKENSLAFAVRELLGAGVSLDAYYSLVTQGFEARTPVEVEKTAFIRFVESIRSLTAGIVGLAATKGLISGSEAGAEPQAGDIGLDADELVGRLVGFLQLCADTTVGADPLVTFAWNVRKITRKYLNEAFPETRDEENMRLLREILGLEEIFTPSVEEEQLKIDYTVYGFEDYASTYQLSEERKRRRRETRIYCDSLKFYYGDLSDLISKYSKDSEFPSWERERVNRVFTPQVSSIGGGLCLLNDYIWHMFALVKRGLGLVLKHVPELKDEYIKSCEKQLERLPKVSVEETVLDGRVTYSRVEEYEIEGPLMRTPRFETRSLFAFLDEIMPAVFLGLYEIVFSEDRRRFVVVRRGC